MIITKLRPDQWQTYREIRLESLQNDPAAFGSTYAGNVDRPAEWWISRLEAAQADPNRTLLFALESERPIGIVGASPSEEPGAVDVISMYVTPTHRNQGIARSLLRAVLAEIQAREVRLAVNASQTPALCLYRSLGFKVVSEAPITRPDGSTDTQFTMSLPHASHHAGAP